MFVRCSDLKRRPPTTGVACSCGVVCPLPPGEAEHLAVRSYLMMAIEQLIKARGLTQTRAARLFGVTQPRVSDLVRGRIELFSIDALVEMLGRAGIGLSIRLEPRRRPA